MINWKLVGSVSFLAFTAYAAPALAQDRCADVLANGTFQTAKYRENSYFQQIIWSRFLSSSFEESKSNKSLGFGVPVGEVVLGGNYDEATFKQKKADIRKELSSTITSTNEIDAALVSGDDKIVSAWSECMKAKGGYVSLRFLPASAKQAFAEIQWVPGPAGSPTGVASTTLEEDMTLPAGVTFASGSSCFKAGKVLLAGISPCRATINLQSASTDLAVSLNAQHGSAFAYLPPRLVLIRETRPYPFKAEDQFQADAFRQEKRAPRQIDLTEEQIKEGWRFDPSSAFLQVEVIQQGHWVHQCNDPKVSADFYSFRYDFRLFASGRNSPERNVSIVCKAHPTINITRDRWLPAGANS